MHAKELLVSALVDQGITTEVVGDAIYRFTQYQCEWSIPQHIIDRMLEHGVMDTKDFIYRKMFYLVRRIDEYGNKDS
ncbi:MAG TPA: hypothetical protein VJ824_00690 [Bacillota bacterium]|nr:hypothetical protein [Bacillota bacterium]